MAPFARRLRPLVTALAWAGLALSQTSHAASTDVIGSASISLTNLQYRLISLDSSNAGTPSTLGDTGTWLGTATQALQPVAGPVDDYGYSSIPLISTQQSTTPLSGLSGSLLSTTAFNVPVGNSGTGIVGTSNSLTLSAVLTAGDLLSTTATSNKGSYTDQGMYDYNHGQVGDRTVAMETTRTVTAGQQAVSLSTAASDGTLHTDNVAGLPLVELSLAPNTMLLVSGTATTSLSADRSNLVAGMAGLVPNNSSYDPFYGSAYYLPEGHYTAEGGSGYGSFNYQAQIFLVDNLDFNSEIMNASGSGLTFSRTVDYSQYVFTSYSSSSATMTPEAMTFEATNSKDWSLYIANTGSTAKTVYLSATLAATASQSMDIYHSTSDITFTPTSVIPDPVGSIPEPGTYALMGLGLAGIALASRRRARG